MALIVLPLIVRSAPACQCLELQPPCAAYWQADAVFVGSVTDITPSFDDLESSMRAGRRKVRFSLEESYRGTGGSEAVLANGVESCEYRFEVGKKYFVYAYRNPEDNTLSTHGCSRTSAAPNATEDLAYVRTLSETRLSQDISGVIQEDRHTPVKGVKIVADGRRRRLQSVSDGEGKFKIMIPGAGRYSVRVFLPRNASVAGPMPQTERVSSVAASGKHTIVEYVLDIQDGGCEFLVVPVVIE